MELSTQQNSLLPTRNNEQVSPFVNFSIIKHDDSNHLGVLLLFLGTSILSLSVVLNDVEDKQANKIAKQVSQIIRSELHVLEVLVFGYACWDDLYFVVESGDLNRAEDFFNTNLLCEYLRQMDVNYATLHFLNG